MANQFATNYPIPITNGSTNAVPALWKLTRLMKAAGWQYRGSGIQGAYDTSGIATNDLWGNSANPSNDAYVTSTGTSPNGVTGATAIYNQTTSINITLPTPSIPYQNTSGSQIATGGGTVFIATTAGWQTVTYTSATGTVGGAGTLNGCSGGTGTLINSGITGPSAIIQCNNNNSNTFTAGNVISLDSLAGWWSASGPQTVQIPLASLPTGTPLRGETVTQAVTGITGEYLGHVWDPVGLTGWMVILPRHTLENTTVAATSDGYTLPQGTINVTSTAGFAPSGILNVWTNPLSTMTIASGSNGVVMAQTTLVTTNLASASIVVGSTAGFPTSGTLYVANTSPGTTIISYTNTSGGNTFTGCTGGAGTGVAGSPINTFGQIQVNSISTINTSSSGNIWVQTSAAKVQPVIYVGASAGQLNFCQSPTATGTLSTGNNIYFVPTPQQITYTGISGNSFTGCTGGTGLMMTSNNVTGYNAVFDNTHTITGSTSGATFTPTGTVTYFQREVVFGKNNNTSNTSNIYYVACDGYLENNQLFSTLAGSGPIGGSVWPGGGLSSGGTTNTFNTISPVTGFPTQICVVGSGGTSGGGGTTFSGTGTNYGSSAQLCAVNAIASAGVTADGSFYGILPAPNGTGGGNNIMTGLLFTRIDDCEPGDLDPYAWLVANGSSTISTTAGSFSRTSNSSNTANLFTVTGGFTNSGGTGNWLGYQARGCTLVSHDVPNCWATSMYWCFQNTVSPIQSFSNTNVNTIRLVAFPSIASPLVREPALLFTTGAFAASAGTATFKQIKGRARWLVFASVGNALDTMDNKTWLAVSNWTQTTLPCILIGPYDGVSTPIP